MIRLEKRWYIIAIAGAAAAALLLLQPWQQDNTILVDTSDLDQEALHDSFARDIHTSLYGERGQLEYTVQAESQMTFGTDRTELTRPVIRLFENAIQRWDVSADQGRIIGNSSTVSGIERMELINRVNVIHSDESGFLMRMQTGFLIIEPDTEVLRTNQRVYISGNGFEHQATGLIAELALDRLTFLSDLEGRYYDQQAR